MDLDQHLPSFWTTSFKTLNIADYLKKNLIFINFNITLDSFSRQEFFTIFEYHAIQNHIVISSLHNSMSLSLKYKKSPFGILM